MSSVTVQAEGLGRTYGARAALAGLDLVVREGEILGLLGSNGAGKTTTIRLLTTVLAATSGRFSVAGVPSTRPQEIRRLVGALPESAGYPLRRTTAEYLHFHARLHGLPASRAVTVADALMAEVGLADRAGSPIGGLSRGLRQRLGIARALVNDPTVVFLDEPTLGLDPAGHRQVLAILRTIAERRRATVVLSTHVLADVEEICSRVAILHRGRLVRDGTVAEVAASGGARPGAQVTVGAGQLGRARSVLAGLPGPAATEVPHRPDTLLLPAGGDPQEPLRAIVDAGIPVRAYEAQPARLDEAFLALTGEESR